MFQSKKEKYAYVQGLKAGTKGKKPYGRNGTVPKKHKTGTTPKRPPADDFIWKNGRISGSYTADGFFEPD